MSGCQLPRRARSYTNTRTRTHHLSHTRQAPGFYDAVASTNTLTTIPPKGRLHALERAAHVQGLIRKCVWKLTARQTLTCVLMLLLSLQAVGMQL